MRSLLSWIWDEVTATFSSVSSSYLMPIMAVIAGIGILSSIYLYQSLHIAQREKEHAIEQMLTLEHTILRLQKTRNADNKIAQIIITKNDIWDTKNTQAALEIAEIPRLEWEQKDIHVQGYLSEHQEEHLGEQSGNHVQGYNEQHLGEQSGNHVQGYNGKNNEKNICSIDTPLPRLSVPLVMLYDEVSRASNALPSAMAYGHNSSASTASKNNDSSTACPVDKRTTHGFR